MDTNEKCFMGIISCQKYLGRRLRQDLSNTVFEYRYFVGDPNLTTPVIKGDIVYLPCEDNYESLPNKVKLMIKWVSENFPDAEYLFKTDDDIRFDFDRLSDTFHYIYANKIDYAGNYVQTVPSISNYHMGKSESNIGSIKIEPMTYCSGGGYFLSKKSVNHILSNLDVEGNIFEDFTIGKILNDGGISPTPIKLHNYSCFW
jgi:hypothetical protein